MTKRLEHLDSAVLFGAACAMTYGAISNSATAFAASAVLFYGSRLTFKRLMHRTLVETRDVLDKTNEALGDAKGAAERLERSLKEPGYREPAKIKESTRVLCGGCRYLIKDYLGSADYHLCRATPEGKVHPVTGQHEKFKFCKDVNKNYDCKKWTAK